MSEKNLTDCCFKQGGPFSRRNFLSLKELTKHHRGTGARGEAVRLESPASDIFALFKEFRHVCNHRERVIEGYKTSTGKRVVGYLCTYVPVEIIHAAGLLPVKIGGGYLPGIDANRLLPSFICPYLRSLAELGLQGGCRYLDGIIHAYTCDAACGVFNIWRRNFPPAFSHIIHQPYLDGRQSLKFYHRELELLIENIERHFGTKAGPDSLSSSAGLYRDIRAALARLYSLRRREPAAFTGEEIFHAVNAGFALPPEEYLEMLGRVNDRIAGRHHPAPGEPGSAGVGAGPAGGKVPVLLSGSHLLDPSVFDLIYSCGGIAVDDDLCNGRRSFDRGPETVEPLSAAPEADVEIPGPLREIIAFYRGRPGCPARVPAKKRLPYLIDLARESGARGVVFAVQKFCDPHLADLPLLTAWLKEAGYPSLILEYDGRINPGAAATRLQAFFEMIGGAA